MPPRTRTTEEPVTVVDAPEERPTLGMFSEAMKVVVAQANARMDAIAKDLSGHIVEVAAGRDQRYNELASRITELAPSADALSQITELISDLDARLLAAATNADAEYGRISAAFDAVLVATRRVEALEGAVTEFAERLEALGSAVDDELESATGNRHPAILRAVRDIMAAVEGVSKHGKMTEGRQHYKFRAWDDVQNALAAEFRRHAVMLQAAIEAHDVDRRAIGERFWTSVTVRVRYVLTSLVDGSTLEFMSVGEGRDLSDKATAKAMTMAAKTFASQAFMLATDDDDPDAERPGDDATPIGSGVVRRPANETEQQRLAREAYEARRTAPLIAPQAASEQFAAQSPQHADAMRQAEQMMERQLGARPVEPAPADPWETHPDPQSTASPEQAEQERKLARAAAALAAAKAPGVTFDRLNAIMAQAGTEGLTNVVVQGSPLKAHLVSIGRTLGGAR